MSQPLDSKHRAQVMADGNLRVSIEQAVHGALREAVQNIMDEFGIRVDCASFTWIDASTPIARRSIVEAVRLDTVTEGASIGRKP